MENFIYKKIGEINKEIHDLWELIDEYVSVGDVYKVHELSKRVMIHENEVKILTSILDDSNNSNRNSGKREV